MTGPRIYNLFPLLVGSVRQWEDHLQRIAAMKFNWIYVNPFHYPGFSGSLYAVKDYYQINELMRYENNDLGTAISSFCQRAAEVKLSVMMDLVINHTSKDSSLVAQHPEWFLREADGSLYSPRAIDPADSRRVTIWGDLAELDYKTPANRISLTNYFKSLVEYFVNLGIHGFRCDAAYKIPPEVWNDLIYLTKSKYKDALFFAETLGCGINDVQSLKTAGFDYIFNSAKWWDFRKPWLIEQYETFRHVAPSIAFPESHDTERLISDLKKDGITDLTTIEQAYRLHYLKTAIFSTGLMIPVGYEFGFSRKLNVVYTRPEDWEKPSFDITDWITDINHMKTVTPVLNVEGPQRLARTDDPALVCLVRRTTGGQPWSITFMNPDFYHSHGTRVLGLDTDMDKSCEITPNRPSVTLRTGDFLLLKPGESRIFVNP